MKANKQKRHEQKNSGSQQEEKFQEKKLSQCRDYISMKAYHSMANTKKRPPKKVEKVQMKVHLHLQPENPQGQVVQVSQQQYDRDGDPTSLLANFNNQNYNEWIKVMKQRIINQKPYTQQHPQLLEALSLPNTNICVYGYGSKIQYLRQVVLGYLGDHYIWQVNGFKGTLNDKKIYNNFGKFLIEAGVTSKIEKITKEHQLQEYRECLNDYNTSKQKQLIVLFHCIDSINFLDCDSQMWLSRLFSLPKIRLICSIDNIKIASIWHPNVKTMYNFTFMSINTSVPYIHEQIFRPNTNDNRDMEEKAIMNIYQSLNNNQKRILKLFAKRQIQNDNKQQPQYFTFDSLLDQCIDNIILSNDMQLRQNLLELLDHKVIVAADKKQGGAKKFYTIKCNKAMLDKIYKQKIED